MRDLQPAALGPAQLCDAARPGRWQRERGDRRGFEPLELDTVPHAVAQLRAAVHLTPPVALEPGAPPVGVLWDGRPVHALHVLMAGGLGDRLRLWPVVLAALRCDRVRVVHVWRHPSDGAQLHTPPELVERIQEHREKPSPADLATPWVLGIHQMVSAWRSAAVRAGVPLQPARVPLHVLLAQVWGLPVGAMAGPVLAPPTAEDLDRLRARLEAGGYPGAGPVVALQAEDAVPSSPVRLVSAGQRLTPRQAARHEEQAIARARWLKLPRAHVARDAARRLTRWGAFPVLVGGGPARRSLEHPGADLRGCSLAELSALCCVADLVVSGCSGPLHLAAMHGAPVLGLYGPTDARVHLSSAGAVALVAPSACGAMPCGLGSPAGMPTATAVAMQEVAQLRGASGFRWEHLCDHKGHGPPRACMAGLSGEAVAMAALWLLVQRGAAVPSVLTWRPGYGVASAVALYDSAQPEQAVYRSPRARLSPAHRAALGVPA